MMKLCGVMVRSALMLVLSIVCSFGAAAQSDEKVPAAAEGISVWVDKPFVDLHMGPGSGYPIKVSAIKGEQLQLLVTRGNWVQVLFRGEKLWLDEVNLAFLLSADKKPFQQNGDSFEQYRQRDWEASFMYGDFNGASYYQVSGGYVFSSVVSSELSVAQASGQQADNQLVELSVYVSPFEHWRISPYFGIGGGMLRINPKTILVQTEDRSDLITSAEVGVKYYLSRNFVARAAYRHGVVSTSRNENDESITWKLGFSVFF
jgi:hypothetical protein